jgi:hypothetical protein
MALRTKLTYLFLFLIGALSAQEPLSDTSSYKIIYQQTTDEYNAVWYTKGNDTLVKATHSPIDVSAKAANRSKVRQYDRLQKKVIKVYPYARAAADVMEMYNSVCLKITDEKERKRLLDQAEEEMKRQFEKDLRGLTVSEGVILIKLIDRETGSNSYALVQELKGKFSAFMWQGLARMFGHNLKSEYEADGEDVWIENIVQQIEDGFIPVERRHVDPFGLKAYSQK